ncbi:MAG: lipase family protein [Burkholderiales bacterium]
MYPIPSRAQARTALAVSAVALLLAACGGDGNNNSARGSLLSDTTVTTQTKAQIDAITSSSALPIQALTGTARCDVTVRKILHSTSGPNQVDGYTATAAVLVPVASATCPGPFPIVAYTPGTEVVKARTLSDPTQGENLLLTAFYAAQGYVVVATDYLGFTESSLSYHPYLHADSQASTMIDAIRAARASLTNQGVPLSGRLFLTGYSQGGHAAMATHKAIEADASLGLTVTAAGPMSGPYDLTNSFVAGLSFLPTGTGGSSIFTPYVVTSWQKIYGNIYSTPADYFKAPYATGIESLLPGTLNFTQLYTTGKLPVNLGDLLTARAVADVGDANSGFRKALAANTLLNWTPRAPVLLCAGSRDPVVLYTVNTAASAANIKARGGNVTEVDVEKVPAFATALPPANATIDQLATYHGSIVPPLCMKVVRDNLFAALR